MPCDFGFVFLGLGFLSFHLLEVLQEQFALLLENSVALTPKVLVHVEELFWFLSIKHILTP